MVLIQLVRSKATCSLTAVETQIICDSILAALAGQWQFFLQKVLFLKEYFFQEYFKVMTRDMEAIAFEASLKYQVNI